MADALQTGVLHRDDNLTVLSEFPSESVDLVYLDPPFFSNRSYEVIWGEEAEVRSFEDRWAGGIQNYIDWMKGRVAELHRVLKSTGSFYLHCDPHASHYLKIMLDETFGFERFRNEVIWKRTGAHNSANRYGPVHDVLLFYSRSDAFTWNHQHIPHDPNSEYVRSHYTQKDSDGRKSMPDNLTAPEVRNGSSGKTWRGFDVSAKGRHWKFTIEGLERLDAAGRIYWPAKAGGWPRYKRYLDEVKGHALQDVWTDIPPINARAAERLGYPTQKPEVLLERIIRASSNRGDIILDPFCGCGTTVAVAERIQRQWIGIDISATAVEIMRRRLLRQHCNPRIENAVQTVTDLMQLKPFEFQNWIINAVYGTHSPKLVGDMGIDGYWFVTNDPIQVKQSEKVGRGVVDNFQTAIRRAGHTTGYVIAPSFTRGAVEEASRAKRDEGLEIKLVKVSEILVGMKRAHGKIGPQPGSVEELPLPAARKPKDMPSAEELIKSDTAVAG